MFLFQQWKTTHTLVSSIIILLYLFLTVESITIELPPLPTNGYQVYLDRVGVLPNYYQIIDTQIDAMNGLWCLSSEGQTEPTWFDPDDNPLPNNMNITVTQSDGSEISIVYIPGAGLGLFAPNDSINFGYYVCRGQNFFTHNILIADSTDPPVPILTNAPPTCTVTSYTPIQDSMVVIGLGIMTDNDGGAPTNVNCSLITAGGHLTFINTIHRLGDTSSTTFIGTQYVVNIDTLANNEGVNCVISNTAGISERNFTCPIQNIPSDSLNVTCTRQDNTMTIEWAATPNTFESFIAFSLDSNGTRSNGVASSIQAVFTNLSPLLSYEACLIAVPSIIDTNAIVAPLNVKTICEGNPSPSPSPSLYLSTLPSSLSSLSVILSSSDSFLISTTTINLVMSSPAFSLSPSPSLSRFTSQTSTPSFTPSPSPSSSRLISRISTTSSQLILPTPTPFRRQCKPGKAYHLQFKLRVTQCREDDFNEIVKQALSGNDNLRERCLSTNPTIDREDFTCTQDKRRNNFRLTLNALVICDECSNLEEETSLKEKSNSRGKKRGKRSKKSKGKKEKSKSNSKSKKGSIDNNNNKVDNTKSKNKTRSPRNNLFRRKLKVNISRTLGVQSSVEIKSSRFVDYYCGSVLFNSNTQTSCGCPNQCN